FSSRRRHTSFSRDWSSDVCSSDLGAATMAYAKEEPLPTIEKVELDRYLGTWYEVARKPLYFQNKCDRDVTATYTLNENGNIVVDNRCIKKDGGQTQSLGEAFVQNPAQN